MKSLLSKNEFVVGRSTTDRCPMNSTGLRCTGPERSPVPIPGACLGMSDYFVEKDSVVRAIVGSTTVDVVPDGEHSRELAQIRTQLVDVRSISFRLHILTVGDTYIGKVSGGLFPVGPACG